MSSGVRRGETDSSDRHVGELFPLFTVFLSLAISLFILLSLFSFLFSLTPPLLFLFLVFFTVLFYTSFATLTLGIDGSGSETTKTGGRTSPMSSRRRMALLR